MDWLINHRDDVVCGLTIGEHFDEKERIFRMLDENGIMIETLIDGYSYIPPTCKIGRGCYIGYLSTLSVNSTIGDGVFLNCQCMCGHDLVIGNFTTLFPRVTVSGHCTIGSKVMIGGCSYIVPGRKIGDVATVAAGSVVFTNVKPGTHVMGNPAKRIEL
jgi:sugar O-acyltransferase (sialic acid O-acetyltransferase NeuD family)